MDNLKYKVTSGALTLGMLLSIVPWNYITAEGISNTTITSEAPAKINKVLYGDTDGNRAVNSLDYTELRSALLKKSSTYANWKTAADVNGDGKVTVLDYLILKNYLAGKIKVFPISQFSNKITDYLRPSVSINISSLNVKVNDKVNITVNAVDDTKVASESLKINGVDVPLDGSSSALYTPNASGVYKVEAYAEDNSGNAGYASENLIAADGTVTQAPQVSINSFIPLDIAPGAYGIIGSALDDNLEKYILEYSPHNENNYTKFAEVDDFQVKNGLLGTCNFGTLANGLYDIKLTAYDKSGNTSSVVVTRYSTEKLNYGELNLSNVDISNGTNFDLIRTYSSYNKSNSDFGYGWGFNGINLNLKLNSTANTLSGKWSLKNKYGVYSVIEDEPHNLIVQYQDGTTDSFKMQLSNNQSAFLPIEGEVSYIAQNGTKSKLEALGTDGTYHVASSENGTGVGPVVLHTGDYYSGEDDEYSVTGFKLTKEDGTIIIFDKDGNEQSIQDSKGNVFSSSGIKYASGGSITFERDSKGHITTASDSKGVTVKYGYDSYGDLVSVTDPTGAVEKYKYNSFHRITDIINNDGVVTSKYEYDDAGRLTAVFDQSGQTSITY
ncbi:MAG: dockerin type I domain-containing protein [Bacillota bacterium]|nr:dockerin type I domain-containing protein [Bacillota bacterium]